MIDTIKRSKKIRIKKKTMSKIYIFLHVATRVFMKQVKKCTGISLKVNNKMLIFAKIMMS
jgi:hypothetical protein